ncbi:hypothetical protein BJ875DRAFT_149643 [Amylocarpus encephaloides]|uniref:Secreted protein n=1 Tax=Amylocarpus encephaloides TaxID=45428 RepID=A0A9P8C275_9HELO|nr:hypothetical protein BJ875DRAFT_149643 [Amylocarpus encephaloides]
MHVRIHRTIAASGLLFLAKSPCHATVLLLGVASIASVLPSISGSRQVDAFWFFVESNADRVETTFKTPHQRILSLDPALSSHRHMEVLRTARPPRIMRAGGTQKACPSRYEGKAPKETLRFVSTDATHHHEPAMTNHNSHREDLHVKCLHVS